MQPLITTEPLTLVRTSKGPLFGKLLIPVDGSAASMAGVYEAIKISNLQQSSLRLLHIVDGLYLNEAFEPGTIGQIVTETTWKAGNQILDEASKVLATYGLTAERRLMDSHENRVATQVIRESAEWSADLIVMGTHGRRGITRLALGSVAEEVARSSPVPVLLVRAGIWTKRDNVIQQLSSVGD
jgi:nucleotide-binding universal stress UspA family protein